MNAAEHRFSAAVVLATAAASLAPSEHRLPHAIAGCIGGFCFGTLPDLFEPATNPHHRQFFHSLFVAGLVGYSVYQAFKWEPETAEGQILRAGCLLVGGAYLVHLALDFTTKRSLPLIGRT